jgi:hypothetical protein
MIMVILQTNFIIDRRWIRFRSLERRYICRKRLRPFSENGRNLSPDKHVEFKFIARVFIAQALENDQFSPICDFYFQDFDFRINSRYIYFS